MTLMETMIAVFVLLTMSVMVFQTLANSIEINELLANRDSTTRAARVAMSKLRRDLQLAYLTPNRIAVNSYQTVFVGNDEKPDTVYFSSLAHQRLYMDTRECDQTEITIWAEDAPSERGKGYVLYHREAPRIDERPDEDGTVLPLAYNVKSFGLRYLDARTVEWTDEWDSRGADTPYMLPRAVEIALVLIGADPDDADRTIDIPFMSTVLLHYADPVVNPEQQLLQGMMAAGQGGAASPFGGGQGTSSPFGGQSTGGTSNGGNAPRSRPSRGGGSSNGGSTSGGNR
jgi:general secretion pathway protein J